MSRLCAPIERLRPQPEINDRVHDSKTDGSGGWPSGRRHSSGPWGCTPWDRHPFCALIGENGGEGGIRLLAVSAMFGFAGVCFDTLA